MFNWYKQVTQTERRTFWVCFGGWALDAVDGQMFTLAIPALISAFALSKDQAGALSSVTLISSALGGWIAGALSDRFGRVRILQLTILWFSAFTFLGALAQTYQQLLVIKALQGFGFGGEWAAGAVLIAEAVRPEHRGKVMGTVQSAWAVGWGFAVILYSVLFSWVEPEKAWRIMFMAGLLPALLVVYVQRALPKDKPRPALNSGAQKGGGFALLGIFRPNVLRVTLIGGLLGVGAHGGYYALMTWLPTFLKTERHLSVLGTSAYLAVIIVSFGVGCLASAQLLDRIGRRRTVALFAAASAVTVVCYLLAPLGDKAMLLLGFPLGFFSAGIPASMGALFSELFPGEIRGTGVGFCYNFGRILSAVFPWLVGHMSKSMPLGRAIGIDAAMAYGLVVVAVLALPETRNRSLRAGATSATALPSGDPAGPELTLKQV